MTDKELQEFKARVQQAHHYRWAIAKAEECAAALVEMGASMPQGSQQLTTAHFLGMIAEIEGGAPSPAPKAAIPTPLPTKPELMQKAAPKIDPHDTSELAEMLDAIGSEDDFKHS
jgi:hypothetical protein